jgi:DNA polymerase-3 subunit beta
MKIAVDQAALTRALDTVRAIVPAKTTLPILGNILLEAGGSHLSLAVTDLDTTVVTRIEADVTEPGGITVHARRFGDLVKDLSRAPVLITVREGIVHVECQKTRAKFPGIDKDEFPKLPALSPKGQFEIDGTRFRRAIRKTSFCVSRDETRPALTGLLWRFTKAETMLVATDGYRLAKVSWKGGEVKEPRDLILTPKPLSQVANLLHEIDVPVKVAFDENHALFQVGATDIYSRLIEGTFPKYEQVIPKESPKRLVINREALLVACRRVSHVSDSLSHQMQLSLGPNAIAVKAESAEQGEVRDELPVEYDGESMEIGFNAAFLMEILKAIDGERVVFRLSTPVTAGLVEPEEATDGETNLFLIMPLRLSEG